MGLLAWFWSICEQTLASQKLIGEVVYTQNRSQGIDVSTKSILQSYFETMGSCTLADFSLEWLKGKKKSVS